MKKKLFKLIKKIFLIFCLIIEKKKAVSHLGTKYGGWYFIKPQSEEDLILISAGVGEDISFDIEFFNKFKSKIIFIDPTPKAISHLNDVIKYLGNPKTKEYDETSGKQLVQSYDLTKIKKENFVLIEKALFNKNQLKIKFFKPKNKEHVSHSISNFQNNYKSDSEFIDVYTITLKEITKVNEINKIEIIKLDIEGAENQVIPHMLKSNIYPKQLLVEFDELRTNYIKPYLKAFYIFTRLLLNQYQLIKIDDFPNFLFLKKTNVKLN